MDNRKKSEWQHIATQSQQFKQGENMNKQQAKQLITSLYNAVDNKDLSYLESILAEHVNFRIGNFNTITDKQSALAANK